jgi:hypothetical protein
MQKNNTKKTRTKQPSTLYKRAKTTPKRTYKRKVKQSPTPQLKKSSLLDWFGFLLVPTILIIIAVGGSK